MAENLKPNEQQEAAASEPEILTNDYGATPDATVVVEEETRTVLLTNDETIVIEKTPSVDVVPKNRARKVYGGMWGAAEIATVGLGLLAVLATIILFVLVVLPAQKELEKNRAERDRIETELNAAKSKYGNITTSEAQAAKIVASANDFEARFLPIASNGRNSLYQNINGLIAAYGLVNTSGPDYAPLELTNGNRGQQTETEQGRAKYQSIFPGVYVTMTVEGSYQNLRRFVREIETSENQFVVISAVELAPAENNGGDSSAQAAAVGAKAATPPQALNQGQIASSNGMPIQNAQMQHLSPQQQAIMLTQTAPPAPQPAKPRGVTHGETVSLHLEMAAYFRRSNIAPNVVQQ